ncbi:hypothetical protein SDC9_175541 [bioreactor metagenome]|uniref:Uncharacterized protein n=1 Tax=bioreactor metagenome TaxID=1076179 RepID=A0A645GQ99_9ZZZZ
MEQRQRRPRIAVRVDPGDHRQAEHAQRERRDDQDQRRAHPPQDEEEDGAHRRVLTGLGCRTRRAQRRSMTDSLIISTTEMTLASSAPADSDTTVDI